MKTVCVKRHPERLLRGIIAPSELNAMLHIPFLLVLHSLLSATVFFVNSFGLLFFCLYFLICVLNIIFPFQTSMHFSSWNGIVTNCVCVFSSCSCYLCTSEFSYFRSSVKWLVNWLVTLPIFVCFLCYPIFSVFANAQSSELLQVLFNPSSFIFCAMFRPPRPRIILSTKHSPSSIWSFNFLSQKVFRDFKHTFFKTYSILVEWS